MAPDWRGEEERDSRRVLARLEREADSSAMPRPRAAPGEEDDWAEYWGKRIGAVLGPALLALAAAWFVWQLSAGQFPA